MTDEQKAAYVIAQAACAMAEIHGMVAENQKRAAEGKAMAYDERDFFAISEKYYLGHNAVLEFFHG